MIRRHVRITGRVQGVFFRDSCRREADRRQMAGWVTNADDGSVEAVFEGNENAVEAMIAWCRRGPSAATVDRVEVSDQSPSGERGFRVR